MRLYEIYISKFKDTNGNNVGDINGIIEQLDYIKSLNIDTIWITPFYPSPLVDNGYDISDYRSIDKRYGDIDDFKTLLKKAHDLDLKVVIDIVLNHTSDMHTWFQKSIENVKPYSDYYIWKDKPTNNWESMFKGSAWTYNEKRKQYYLHRFAKEQPDLNHTNEKVLTECINILKFWLDIGVDGFRFDVINFLISNEELLYDNDNTSKIDHPNTINIIKKLKKVIKAYKNDVIFIGEIGSEDLDTLAKYESDEMMDYVFCFNISSQKEYDIKQIVSSINSTKKVIKNPTIFFSSHDMSRYYRRLCNYDNDKYLILSSLILFTNDLSIFYQGDELKIREYEPRNIKEIVDIQATNEYQVLLDKGYSNVEAFATCKKNSRDYSRNLINWNNEQVSDSLLELIALSKEYVPKDENYSISYIDCVITIMYTSVKFKIYDNATIEVYIDGKKIKTIGVNNE